MILASSFYYPLKTVSNLHLVKKMGGVTKAVTKDGGWVYLPFGVLVVTVAPQQRFNYRFVY